MGAPLRLLLLCLLGAPLSAHADLQAFFAGYIYQFGYGGGTSSNNPRVELVIHYCPDGRYLSQGQSCRPNIIARGYQCSPLSDAGQWRVQGSELQWQSLQGNVGTLQLIQHPNGAVTDPRGNPFIRMGPARCP